VVLDGVSESAKAASRRPCDRARASKGVERARAGL
jgi:hypothetical protein